VSLFDPGLQPERTGLAWRRTMISLAVVSLAGVRFLHSEGAWLFVPVLVGLVAAIALLVGSERRYRSRQVRAGGLLVPLTAATTLLLGAAAAVYVLAAS
jgi:uncharacterized membrane protein YidH (DUF202 family)